MKTGRWKVETRFSVAVTVELSVDSVGVEKEMPPDENLRFLGRGQQLRF